MTFTPCVVRSMEGSELVSITLGDSLLDGYLEFVGTRGARNTWLATAYDLKVFFEVIAKQPAEVTAADVFAFLAAQRTPRRGERVVRIEDGEAGLAARTIARRVSSVAGLFEYLLARGDAGVASNPVPRGLAGRRAGRRGRGGVRLVRTPRTLPRVLSPGEVDALLGALRTRRDRAMVLAMLLGGLRRCEVLGLRLCDVNIGERRLHITCGKGGRERIVPVSGRFFAALGEYLELERPAVAVTEACFVVLKGPRRGLPLSPAGLDEVLDGARARAGLSRCTCHQLRHTCLTRLREQGMALEAVQAQAGHASIESTRIYLHLANDWLASEYLAAAEAIDAQLDPLAGELAARDPHVEALVAAYRADLEAAEVFAENEVTSPARSFLLRVRLDGWSAMALDQQLAVCGHDRRLVAWLIVTGRVRPTADYLVASKLRVGKVAAGIYREFHGQFRQIAAELGFDPKSAELQWWAVAKVAAVAGVSPERLTKAQLDAGREQLIAATCRLHPDHPMRARPLTTRLHGAEATLFHAGVIDVPPRKRHPDKSAVRARQWAAVPPRLRATLEGYIEQMRLSLRPATMVRVEAVLRGFAGWLTAQEPEVRAVGDLRRAHIERYKRHLAERPSVRGGRLSKIGLAEQLGTLRVCLERLSEWDGEGRPHPGADVRR